MIYLASPVMPSVWPYVADGTIGVLYQPAYRPRTHHDLAGTTWAADNGCYAAGDAFDLDKYLAFLDRLPHEGRRLFATAPDVLGDPDATWARSRDVLPELRARGWPAALVAQDGFDAERTEWDAFDVLFVGGSTAWKLGSGLDLALVAHEYGKRAHLGRVNSYKRLAAARAAGFDSADGTFLAYSPDYNLPRLLAWLRRLHAEPDLWASSK